MLNQFATPPRIPISLPLPQNQEKVFHVVNQQRQMQFQPIYYSPEIIKPFSQQSISTQVNSPISNGSQPHYINTSQYVNCNNIQNQYNLIMQYYKELGIRIQQQRQENHLKYKEILEKIDNTQQTIANNMNQLNINQRNKYQQLLQELQEQRVVDQKRYELLLHSLEQQKTLNNDANSYQQGEQMLQYQNQLIEEQNQQITNLNNILIIQPSCQSDQQLQQQYTNTQNSPQYPQIHNQQKSPQIQVSQSNQNQDSYNFDKNSGNVTPFIQNSQQQQSKSLSEQDQYNFPSNKQFLNNQMTNQIVQQTKSPRDQISSCVYMNCPNNQNRDNVIQYQRNGIFEKPTFEKVNKEIVNQNSPNLNQDKQIIQNQISNQIHHQQQIQSQAFNPNLNNIIDDSKDPSKLLQQLKIEYGINSLTYNTSLQQIINQLQLIYCLSCDQYIQLQMANQHLQICTTQRPQYGQDDSYLYKYLVCYQTDPKIIETCDIKTKRICQQIQKIKQLMQLAQLQKRTSNEYIYLKEYCQISIKILDTLLQNPDCPQIIKYYEHIDQILNVIFMSPQIFYKQQAKLLQFCLEYIKELIMLFKK